MRKVAMAALALGIMGAVGMMAEPASAFWYSGAWKNNNTSGSFTRAGKTVSYSVGAVLTGVVNAAVSANNTPNTRHRVQAECSNGGFWELVTGQPVSATTVGGFDNSSWAYCIRGGAPRRGRGQLDQ